MESNTSHTSVPFFFEGRDNSATVLDLLVKEEDGFWWGMTRVSIWLRVILNVQAFLLHHVYPRGSSLAILYTRSPQRIYTGYKAEYPT